MAGLHRITGHIASDREKRNTAIAVGENRKPKFILYANFCLQRDVFWGIFSIVARWGAGIAGALFRGPGRSPYDGGGKHAGGMGVANRDLRDWVAELDAAGPAGDRDRRRPRGGDRRHRRHRDAQDDQPGGDVRRGAGLPQGPPGARQHPDLGAAHQPRPSACRSTRPRWRWSIAGATTCATSRSTPRSRSMAGRSTRTCSRATQSTSPPSPRRAGTSATAATISAPPAWW